jgi:hypothetical protein
MLQAEGFVLRVSRSLEQIREYARDRYAGELSKRIGLVASSKFRTLAEWGVSTARHPYWYYGEWFEAAPAHPRSGCRLELAVSEFGCQGLELDLPLLCWGPDLTWSGSGWLTPKGRSRDNGLGRPLGPRDLVAEVIGREVRILLGHAELGMPENLESANRLPPAS